MCHIILSTSKLCNGYRLYTIREMVGASLFDTIVEIGNPTLFLVISYFRFPQMV